MNKIGNNFMDDYYVKTAYERWINSATLFEHDIDRARFYSFVESCVKYVKGILFVKKETAWKELHIEFLERRLALNLADLQKTDRPTFERQVHEILSKFEILIEYEKHKDFC